MLLRPPRKTPGNDDNDLHLIDYADADFNFDWSLSPERIANPMNQYMLSYHVKTFNTMMDSHNIDEAVLRNNSASTATHSCYNVLRVILSIMSITKNNNKQTNITKQKNHTSNDILSSANLSDIFAHSIHGHASYYYCKRVFVYFMMMIARVTALCYKDFA